MPWILSLICYTVCLYLTHLYTTNKESLRIVFKILHTVFVALQPYNKFLAAVEGIQEFDNLHTCIHHHYDRQTFVVSLDSCGVTLSRNYQERNLELNCENYSFRHRSNFINNLIVTCTRL